MKIFDCTLINFETEMLLLRLRTLAEVVDAFVVVEAGMTHSGLPKAQEIAAALDSPDFAPFRDKLHYHFSPTLDGTTPLEREQSNLRLMNEVLDRLATPGDMVMVGAVDEFPRPEAVRQIPPQGAKLELDLYYYSFSWRVRVPWWIGALPYGVERDPNLIRLLTGHNVPSIPKAGWHLGYFFPPERVVTKLNSMMSQGLADRVPRELDWIAQRMKTGKDLYGRTTVIEYEPPQDVPPYVAAHPDHYRALGWLEVETVRKD